MLSKCHQADPNIFHASLVLLSAQGMLNTIVAQALFAQSDVRLLDVSTAKSCRQYSKLLTSTLTSIQQDPDVNTANS